MSREHDDLSTEILVTPWQYKILFCRYTIILNRYIFCENSSKAMMAEAAVTIARMVTFKNATPTIFRDAPLIKIFRITLIIHSLIQDKAPDCVQENE